MRAVVQRVSRAEVRVEGEAVGAIDHGFLLLVAVAVDDSVEDVHVLADKVATMRVFPDSEGRMNRSLGDVNGSVLVVSQFTLAADLRRGRRPSFSDAADPEVATGVLDALVDHLRSSGVHTETGRFGAMMEVELVNDGPVTFVIDVIDGAILPSQPLD
ncbi:MAG TPA: D-aminoacyl-tRNA deacylase [Acidimicrobiia bacterium]|nr:D-aminoacyl-tRNA deacylase [Acidimicrobiia bacterium]